MDLNNIIEIYAPSSVKNGNFNDAVNKFPGSVSSGNEVEDELDTPDESKFFSLFIFIEKFSIGFFFFF